MSKITEEDINKIYDRIDCYMQEGSFAIIDAIFKAMLTIEDDDWRLTYLMAAYPCKSKLKNWDSMIATFAHDPKLVEGME